MLRDNEALMLELSERVIAAAREHGVPVEVGETIATLDLYCRDLRRREALDTLPAGWNRPAPASTDELESTLRDALEHVVIGDSWEGTITWSMPLDEPELEGAEFGLVARYRVGNLQGQGGLRVFTRGGLE